MAGAAATSLWCCWCCIWHARIAPGSTCKAKVAAACLSTQRVAGCCKACVLKVLHGRGDAAATQGRHIAGKYQTLQVPAVACSKAAVLQKPPPFPCIRAGCTVQDVNLPWFCHQYRILISKLIARGSLTPHAPDTIICSTSQSPWATCPHQLSSPLQLNLRRAHYQCLGACLLEHSRQAGKQCAVSSFLVH